MPKTKDNPRYHVFSFRASFDERDEILDFLDGRCLDTFFREQILEVIRLKRDKHGANA